MVANYLRAAARGATSSKAVTIYLDVAGRPNYQYMVVDFLPGPWPRARPCGGVSSNVSSLRTLQAYGEGLVNRINLFALGSNRGRWNMQGR
jgi:hypothetical protein